MAPRPESRASYEEPSMDGSEIVISGIAGRYPNSHSIKELQENLFAKADLITPNSERWDTIVPDLSNHLGMIDDLSKFDAQFFGVHYKQADAMEPMLKKLLEVCCEAIIDAGVNPRSLRGTKVGVYVAGTMSENERQWIYDSKKIDGYGLTGTCRAMYANRLSYWLGVTAPSYSMDGADSTGTMALEQAFSAIQQGLCDSAIVGGANMALHPFRSLQLSRMGFVSKSGTTKSFSEDGDGLARGESVSILYLQRAKDAKRVYAQVVAAKTSFSTLVFDDQHAFQHPSGPEFKEFLHRFYEEINVDPSKVQYVEANGLGLPENDREEIEAIDDVFCSKKRAKPLAVGSITSNIGNTESSRGLCSLMKVLIAYHTGKIPANLHTDNPLKIDAFQSGRVRLVKDELDFDGGYAAINEFAYTGVVSHILLKGYQIDRIIKPHQTAMPELVCLSGRTERSIEEAIADLVSKPISTAQLALLREAYNVEIPGFMIRSYNILTSADAEKKSISLSNAQNYYGGDNRPVWFVYSGMGSQWTTMGSHLMNIPIFREAVQKCHNVLEPYGEDLISVLTSDDKTIFDNIKNSFIGIAAAQIGLTDVLKAVGIVPTNIIGHSVGELGCAYADGCLTAEQMIMAAYCRGLVSLQTPLIKGAMAAVGVGYNTVKNILPEDIEVACHNSSESCTISGPAESLKDFVAELTAKGIFAKQVPTSNIAYHSRYIAPAGPNLLKYMKDVIKNPKERSSRWVSTSVPQSKWDEEIAKTCSAEYLTNNLLSSVLFEETAQLIHSNAIVIEIAPHGLLQAILKRSLSPDCIYIPLTRRGHSNNVQMVLDGIGKMYLAGLSPQVQNLYPEVQYPVPPETPYISHILKWNHDEDWKYMKYKDENIYQTTERVILISRHDDSYKYMNDYVLGDAAYVPPSAILLMVWETLGMVLNIPYQKMPVQFQKIRYDGDIRVPDEDSLQINIVIQRASGCFEVIVEDTAVVRGIIETKRDFLSKINEQFVDSKQSLLSSEDIYRLFSNRGHNYKNKFRSLVSVTQDFTKGTTLWDGSNWIAMLDAVIQMPMLKEEGISKPKFIESLIIDLKEMNLAKPKRNETSCVDIEYFPLLDVARCFGIELRQIEFDIVANRGSWICQQIFPCKQSIKNEGPKPSAGFNQILSMTSPGDLDNLYWIQNEDSSKPQQNAVYVKVHYARISYLDLMKAQGRLMPGDDISNDRFGMSFSGVTSSGERVMGLVKSGAASDVVAADPDLLWSVPDHWTLEEAATVPQAYVQAYYCLTQRTQLERNSKVLITSGAGAFGQAAISVCLSQNCEVFTTVSDARKKRLLIKLFPQLKESNIINTKEDNAVDIVANGTDGKGCEVVINSLYGTQRRMLMNCTRNIFMDINVEDMIDGSYFGMCFLFGSKNYVSAMFSHIFDEKNTATRRDIRNLIYKNICDGWVRPTSHVSYDSKDVNKAFRLISARRNHGAVLIRMQNKQAITIPISSWKCSDGTYVVVCGKKNLGIEIADTLVKMGAKNLLVHTEEPNMKLFKLKLSNWKQQGVTIRLSTGSFNEQLVSSNLLSLVTKTEQLKGIFIVAPDGNSTNEDIIKLIRNLESATRIRDLQYVVLTSLSQNAPGNQFVSSIEAICSERVKSGLQAKSISCLPKVEGGFDVIAMSSILAQVSSKFNIILSAVDQSAISLVPMSKKLDKSVLDYVMSILGMNADDLTEDLRATTLEQIGVDIATAKCLSFNLQLNYGICLPAQRILTAPLSTFENYNVASSESDVSGWSVYFTFCNPDEHSGTQPLLWTRTIVSGANNIVEGSNDEDYMIILPGLDGNGHCLRAMCRRLKLKALMCNYSTHTTTATVEELAEFITEKIHTMVGVNRRFYILGSSFGTLLALEMAALLEKQGHYGKIFCIDGSPDATQKIFDRQVGVKSDEELQNEFLQHYASKITNESCDKLKPLLEAVNSFANKIELTHDFIRNKTSLTSEYIRDLLNAGWLRLEQQKKYKPVDLKIQSPIVLMKAPSDLDLPEDYGLRNFTSGAVTVYNLDSNHFSIMKDVNINNVIDRELDEDILQKLASANLCIRYIEEWL